jgi:hypothetical protein
MLADRREYSHLKEEALDRIKWRNHFGRGLKMIPAQYSVLYATARTTEVYSRTKLPESTESHLMAEGESHIRD